MTFAPDVEARFKRIEDAQVVAAELLHRFEIESRERFRHVEAVQDAMARWQDQMADKQAEMEANMAALIQAQLNSEAKSDEMKESIAELSRTVDRFLKARTNGGEN